MEDFGDRLAEHAASVEALLDRTLPSQRGPQARLFEAMRYAILNGGKRLRPFLVQSAAGLFDVPAGRALRVGAAIELIHGYSLIHDDLPAMDDAQMRRGRPSCHRRFDEATAILAGDALQSLAFEILAAEDTHPDPDVRLDLIRCLALAAGGDGMCGGQMIDLEAEGRSLDLERTIGLQRLKTGALFRFACEAGAVLGAAPAVARQALGGYADDFGLAFQITDDLLDLGGDPNVAGKDLGLDVAAGKATLVTLLGVEGAKQRLEALRRSAERRLEPFGAAAAPLRALFAFVIVRLH